MQGISWARVMNSRVYVLTEAAGALARGVVIPGDTAALADHILHSAVTQGASDIHIQAQEGDAVVRLRVNGVLACFMPLTTQEALRLLSRLKVLMDLDVIQNRQPQDGALQLRVNDRTIDVRGSFFPSIFGEKAVVRLLDATLHSAQLYTLPFAPAMLRELYAITRLEQGLFLATGPTGSGKTTTLYAMLQAVDRVGRNVVTLENPVEYRIEHTTQTQLNAHHSLTFGQALRSLLRQDPDVALIGELRDHDTVHSAIEAALTGHLVFSSLHAARAAAVPVRLREMGVEPYLIMHALSGVIAQRLLSVLCNRCKFERPLSSAEKQWVDTRSLTVASTFQAAGCSACRSTGVEGQVVVAELWKIEKEAGARLLDDAQLSQEDCERLACQSGMVPMLQVAAELVAEGTVALSELVSKEL